MPFIPENNDESPLKRPAQVLALAALASLSFCRDPQTEKPAPVAHASQHVQTETRRIVTNTHAEPEAEPADTASQNEAIPDSEPEEEVIEADIEDAMELTVPYGALSALSACITENNDDTACRIDAGIIDSSLMCYSLSEPERPALHVRHTTLEGELPNETNLFEMANNGEYPLWNEVDTRRFIMAPGIWGWSTLPDINESQVTDLPIPLDDMESGLEDLCDRATTWFDKEPGDWCTGENCERMASVNTDWISGLNEDLDHLAPFEDALGDKGWDLTETDDSFTLGFQLNDETSLELRPSNSTTGVNISITTAVENGHTVKLSEALTPEDLIEMIKEER